MLRHGKGHKYRLVDVTTGEEAATTINNAAVKGIVLPKNEKMAVMPEKGEEKPTTEVSTAEKEERTEKPEEAEEDTTKPEGEEAAEQNAEEEAPKTSLPKVPKMEMGERDISFEITLPPSVFLVSPAANDNGLIRDPKLDLDFQLYGVWLTY
jgi:hypothetical protein